MEGIAVTLRRRGPLHGVDFALRLPSVGATMTLMMAATQAGGTTILRGAACEPEICDLANFLRACGAHITGAGTPVVVIQGGKPLQGTAWTPLPDRIAAATYAAALACAGGEVTVTHCAPRLLCGLSRLFAGGGRGCCPPGYHRHAGPKPRPAFARAGKRFAPTPGPPLPPIPRPWLPPCC